MCKMRTPDGRWALLLLVDRCELPLFVCSHAPAGDMCHLQILVKGGHCKVYNLHLNLFRVEMRWSEVSETQICIVSALLQIPANERALTAQDVTRATATSTTCSSSATSALELGQTRSFFLTTLFTSFLLRHPLVTH